MESNKIKIFERILGVIIILTALSKYQLLLSLNNNLNTYSALITLLFFISALAGFIGLFNGKIWGYIGIYIFIPVSTYGMGISVFPFIMKSFPPTYRTTIIIVIGAVILLTAILIHILKKVSSNNNTKNSLLTRASTVTGR